MVSLTGSCPKNDIVWDFSGDISIPNFFFTLFCNVNSPLCKLSFESAIMTWSSAKSRLFIFVLVHEVVPFL